MIAPTETSRLPSYSQESVVEGRYEQWAHVHVNWTAVWVGTLAAISILLLFGLAGTALGAHLVGPENRIVDLKKLSLWAVVFGVCGDFFSSVAGGWIAAKIAGIRHSEPAMIHGAIVWGVTVPLLAVGAAVGAANVLGGWYGGLSPAKPGNVPFVRPEPPAPPVTQEEVSAFKAQQSEYSRNVKQWVDETPQRRAPPLWGRLWRCSLDCSAA